MKKLLPLIFILFVGVAFGQKKEIKKAIKLFDAGDIKGSISLLESSAALFETADEKYKNKKTFLEARIDQANKKFQSAYDKFLAYKAAGGDGVNYDNQLQKFTGELVNSAIEDNAEKRFSEAASKLYLAYQADTTVTDYLYFAAASAVNAEEYQAALKFYNELKEIKYDGIITTYFGTSLETGEETEFSKQDYDLFKKSNQYKDFREEDSDSKFPEIVKNIALIYVNLGDDIKAMEAVKEARITDPKDLNLILTEANLYIQLKDNDRFEALMKEAIAQDPTNASLYFNLGVVNADKGNSEEARSYYEKTIELDPEYESGYLNLVALILEGETSIVEEMNKLGNSRADNASYDILKKERESVYEECVPILEKLISLNQDEEAVKTLMNIYGTLGNNEGFMKMKNLLK